ncbi:amidohydrolase [Prescottella agglutinans]|uniref:Amidohydrolase YtcJ n=1 Tax=Prescottella agglutinans TaxID=1644129 RepID=A0ABT6M900_9NOCA|nr:amidohydrolase [Prescottella agglutinans]MDH6280788.1 putative amidohydrolase YtcJ [Prescottella agglutinans]
MSINETPLADVILKDAPIFRNGGWDGNSLAIKDGRILAIGSVTEMEAFAGPDTEVESLEGRWILPAFHDSHVHPVGAGLEINQCDLTSALTIQQCQETIAAYAQANPDLEWISGGGWSMDSFPGGVPTAELLDEVVSDRPVFLPNRDHHSAWVNTRALEIAGIDSNTPDPEDGVIVRDSRGRPTGALHEGAMGLVGSLLPEPTDEELMAALMTAQAHMHSIGIVGWQDALVGTGLGMRDYLDLYIAAHQQGVLTAKVVLALWWDRDQGLEQLPELLERRERAARVGIDASTVKIMQDGVCETHTAAMIHPYLDGHGHATDNRGLSFIEAEDLATYVAALDAEDFQIHIHALGDRAVRDSLDAVEHARKVNGARGNRHHLAHVQVVDPADVPRFAELDVVVNGQPLWACREDAMEVLTLPFITEGAREQQYVFGSLLRAGARIAFGSDWPVSPAEPLHGMHVAVNRRAPDASSDVDPLLADEAISVHEALAGYTTGTAYVNRLEDSSGRLDVGYAADIVVIDQDILAIDPATVARTQVTHTFVDGKAVYRS